MKKLIIALALLLITAYEIKPPQLTAKVNEESIKVYQGSYCWKEIGRGVCADTMSPEEMVKRDVPTVVSKGEGK
ncbi:hypothetical protein J2S09_000850 [Bacillus fengqiuensis]|nr:hypothetical protein [Bacillus fengqiuensis]